jgi:hypothetical protein
MPCHDWVIAVTKCDRNLITTAEGHGGGGDPDITSICQ